MLEAILVSKGYVENRRGPISSDQKKHQWIILGDGRLMNGNGGWIGASATLQPRHHAGLI
jgi:hypothetical protein